MTNSLNRDALISECAELLRDQADIFDGNLGQSTLNSFRLHAAQIWLKENPSLVLHLAESSKSAAQTMLTATGVYLAKGGEITTENRHAISKLLIASERLLSKKGGEDRANRTMMNIAVVLLIEGLRRKHQISPTRNPASDHKSSGCDILAEAIRLSGLGTPNTYLAVKAIWDKRKNLLGYYTETRDVSGDPFGSITHDLKMYIETVASADLYIDTKSVHRKNPKT